MPLNGAVDCKSGGGLAGKAILVLQSALLAQAQSGKNAKFV